MSAPAPVDCAWLDVQAAVENTPPPLDFVLPGLLVGTVGALVSAGGAGKTMAALELAVLVAAGYDLLDVNSLSESAPDVPMGKVTYLSAEDPAQVLQHRIHAIGARMPAPARAEMYAGFRIAPLVGQSADIDNPAWQSWITSAAQDSRLLILDTLRRFHTRDENDGAEMAQLLGWMEALCRETRTTILFLHHASKAGALAGGDVQQASRGSSVLVDNIRWQANLTGMTQKEAKKHGVEGEERKHVRLIVTKQNYGAPLADQWLRRGVGGVLTPARLQANTKADVVTYARVSNGGCDGNFR